jgi:hypothetical protein
MHRQSLWHAGSMGVSQHVRISRRFLNFHITDFFFFLEIASLSSSTSLENRQTDKFMMAMPFLRRYRPVPQNCYFRRALLGGRWSESVFSQLQIIRNGIVNVVFGDKQRIVHAFAFGFQQA